MRRGRMMSAVMIVLGLVAAMIVASAPTASAADPMPANCPDGRQIGSTAYVRWHGEPIASVKQYYSPRCRANWSYVYVWESFRDRGYIWTTAAWVHTWDGRDFGAVERDGWIHTYSTPAGTVNVCTYAAGRIWIYQRVDRWPYVIWLDFAETTTGWSC